MSWVSIKDDDVSFVDLNRWLHTLGREHEMQTGQGDDHEFSIVRLSCMQY